MEIERNKMVQIFKTYLHHFPIKGIFHSLALPKKNGHLIVKIYKLVISMALSGGMHFNNCYLSLLNLIQIMSHYKALDAIILIQSKQIQLLHSVSYTSTFFCVFVTYIH